MNSRFARLWVAGFCSEVAEWMLQIALPVLVFQQTGSTASTAAMMVVGLLPAVLLSPVTGIVTDRVHRPRLLLAVCAGQAVVAAPLLVDDATCWVVMAAQTSLAAFAEPARSAVVPDVVPPDRVTAANGLVMAGNNIARLAGAWLGGVTLAVGGIPLVYTGYAGVLAVGALALAARFPISTTKAGGKPVRDWLDGLVMIRENCGLWAVGGALTAMSLAQGMFLVLFVPFVLDTLHAGAAGVGMLRGVQAVGGLAAGFAVATIARRVAPDRMLAWGALCFGIVSAVIWHGPALTTALGVYAGLFIAAGVPGVFANSGLVGVLQTAVPAAATGRLIATALAAMALGSTAGMLLAGAFDTPLLLDVQAALLAGSGALLLAHQHRHRVRDARRASGAGREPAELQPGQQRDDRAGQPLR